jgi:hypothetical protein
MHIARSLGIHKCDSCKFALVDQNFVRSGIHLSGKYRWKAFFDYVCPNCKHKGSYRIDPKGDGGLPGDFFRQFGDALDEYHERQSTSKKNDNLRDLLDDTKP